MMKEYVSCLEAIKEENDNLLIIDEDEQGEYNGNHQEDLYRFYSFFLILLIFILLYIKADLRKGPLLYTNEQDIQ